MKFLTALKTFFTHYFFPWGIQLLHIIAFVILLSHIVPEDLIKEWKKEGYLALYFLGTGLIIALFLNFWLFLLNRSDVEKKENNFKAIRKELKTKISFLEEGLKANERKIRYADIFSTLNYAFSELHNSLRIKANTKEVHVLGFKNFCTKLSQAFEHITQEKCHVCIKLVIKKNKKGSEKISNFIARTLVRDSLHTHRETIDLRKDIEHGLNDNTDFKFIFENIRTEKGRCFFSNNLATIEHYTNTSFLKEGESKSYFAPNTSAQEKEAKWPLPYISVINAPICLGISNQKTDSILIGFLSVDCAKKDIFIEGIDTEIVAGCADGLFNALRNYLELYFSDLKMYSV